MQFRLFIRVLREPLESAPSFFSPILPGKHAINSSSESNSFCGDWFGRIDSTAWKARFLEHGRKSLWELLYFKSIDAKRAQKMATSPNLCIKVDEPSHDRDTIQMLLIYMLYWIVLSTLVETEKRANVSSYVLLFFWNSILNSFSFRTKFMRFKTKTFIFSKNFYLPKFRSLFLDIFLFWHASFAQLIILHFWWVPTINYIAGRLTWENSRHLATLPLVFPPNDDVVIIS